MNAKTEKNRHAVIKEAAELSRKLEKHDEKGADKIAKLIAKHEAALETLRLAQCEERADIIAGYSEDAATMLGEVKP